MCSNSRKLGRIPEFERCSNCDHIAKIAALPAGLRNATATMPRVASRVRVHAEFDGNRMRNRSHCTDTRRRAWIVSRSIVIRRRERRNALHSRADIKTKSRFHSNVSPSSCIDSRSMIAGKTMYRATRQDANLLQGATNNDVTEPDFGSIR